MPRKPPRYDVPNRAPEPLQLVQAFVNTLDLEHDREWLIEWLAESGVSPSPADLDRAREVREALRELLFANNGQPVHGEPWWLLNEAASAAQLTIDFADQQLAVQAAGVNGVLGRVLVIAYAAMADGSWPRLKACRNHGCRWAFYDRSKNRSASWCSMQLCGNRTKIRAYRRRHASSRP